MLCIQVEVFIYDDVLFVFVYFMILFKDVSFEMWLICDLWLKFLIFLVVMDIVIEVCFVIVMVQFGGMGIIYKNLIVEQQVVEVVQVKKFEVGVICDLIMVGLEIIICDVLVLIQVCNIFGVLVVDGGGQLVGIVIYCDMCFEIELDDLVCYIMIKKD